MDSVLDFLALTENITALQNATSEQFIIQPYLNFDRKIQIIQRGRPDKDTLVYITLWSALWEEDNLLPAFQIFVNVSSQSHLRPQGWVSV